MPKPRTTIQCNARTRGAERYEFYVNKIREMPKGRELHVNALFAALFGQVFGDARLFRDHGIPALFERRHRYVKHGWRTDIIIWGFREFDIVKINERIVMIDRIGDDDIAKSAPDHDKKQYHRYGDVNHYFHFGIVAETYFIA